MPDKPLPTDYRKTRRLEERRLVLLVIVALVGIGTGLIGLIWGGSAALFGGVCLVGGAVLIGGLWFLLGLLQKLVDE